MVESPVDHTIARLTRADLKGVLALNNAHAKATSPLDLAALTELVEMACYARGTASGVDSFLVALQDGAEYSSPNYHWFAARYSRFLYIDRIIVAEHARRRGLGRRLYEDLFAFGLAHGHRHIVAEVNLDPPNPISDAFHAALGFQDVGRATIKGGTKVVRYYERAL